MPLAPSRKGSCRVSRGPVATYATGSAYQVRIELKAPQGARYYWRPADSPASWELLYDSSYGNATNLRRGVTVLNAPGTIDEDYRGELKVLLVNLGEAAFTVEPGMRIAQLVVARYEAVRFAFVEADAFESTVRGTGGFGYDPLFISDDLGQTFGEAAFDEKHAVSHRGRAFRALAQWLQTHPAG